MTYLKHQKKNSSSIWHLNWGVLIFEAFLYRQRQISSVCGYSETMSGDFHVSIYKESSEGYHVYQTIWMPDNLINEELSTMLEHGNHEDAYAVSIMKSAIIVGHVPRELSKNCWNFIARDGGSKCEEM